MADTVYVMDFRQFDLDAFQGKKYGTIVCDAAWLYNDAKLIRKDGKTPSRGVGACHTYAQMQTPEIAAMPIAELANGQSMLHLWGTCPLMSDAFQVVERWGYRCVTVGVFWAKMNPKAWQDADIWRKAYMETWCNDAPAFERIAEVMNKLTRANPGYYSMSNVEFVLLGARGDKAYHWADGHKPRQVVWWPMLEPSRKPEIFQSIIEASWPQAGPRLELFSRRYREGWDHAGLEADGHMRREISGSSWIEVRPDVLDCQGVRRSYSEWKGTENGRD